MLRCNALKSGTNPLKLYALRQFNENAAKIIIPRTRKKVVYYVYYFGLIVFFEAFSRFQNVVLI